MTIISEPTNAEREERTKNESVKKRELTANGKYRV